MDIKLLTTRAQVEPYLNDVRAAADTARASFGFLPHSAYDEFAYQNRMIVAVEAESQKLVGYVLYGGAIPQGRIFQTWCAPGIRGEGVGRQLVEEVVKRLEKLQYLSIRADVAQDLVEASNFYASLGFEAVRTRPGRTRGRVICVRVRELATFSLLDIAESSEGGFTFPISLPAATKAPLYVIDLNVLFDVARQRSRASSSGKVMAAAFENNVRLAVSAELIAELQRHARPDDLDPILAFAASLPRLPLPPSPILNRYSAELARLVFPDRERDGILKPQDRSDLIHLITAAQECAAGFITSEKAILKASVPLRERYGIEVVSPESFGSTFEMPGSWNTSPAINAVAGAFAAQTAADQDYDELAQFLANRHLSPKEVRAQLACGTQNSTRRKYFVRFDARIIAFAGWEAPRPASGARDLDVYVDEAHSSSFAAADYLIRRATTDTGSPGPAIYRLRLPKGQPSIRRAAIANGFFRAAGSLPRAGILQKVAVGRIVGSENWASVREKLAATAGITLPARLPEFTDAEPIEIADGSGKAFGVSLLELEHLLSPLILVLPARPAVVLPIRRSYAEELFRGSAQPSFLNDRQAILRSSRGYIGGSATYNAIPDGGLAIFYESGTGGGRSAATAVARITGKYLMQKSSASRLSVEKGALTPDAIETLWRGPQVVVTEFEDIMLFKNPVRIAQLRRIGCVDAANFVTARSISPAHAIEIIGMGLPNG
jgi:ribosomal protein S18 acetylase RimI-like enzyme